jgi:hypothetical protein
MKSRTVGWTGHVGLMGKKIIVVGKSEGRNRFQDLGVGGVMEFKWS